MREKWGIICQIHAGGSGVRKIPLLVKSLHTHQGTMEKTMKNKGIDNNINYCYLGHH
jgi:hypothetical protein